MTSVTIRKISRNAVQAGIHRLAHCNLRFSEQRLMRECLRVALKLWRGRKGIAERSGKYNHRSGPYEIVPFYTTEALRSASRARCHHSGIALSRMMDLAITIYLPRVLEYWLRFDYQWRDRQDVEIWRAKYNLRHNSESFVISYYGQTRNNNGRCLDYSERIEIMPWPPPFSAAA